MCGSARLCAYFRPVHFEREQGESQPLRRAGRSGRGTATGRLIAFWSSDEVKTRSHSVEYSTRRCCAIWYCARQSLYDRILPVQDRASCLPESSRRALVADAREIRQYQMHPPSLRRSVTDTQSVALLSSWPGATLAAVLRMQPRRALPLQFSASRSLTSRLHRDGTTASRETSLRISPSAFNCRPSAVGLLLKLPEHTPENLQAEFFSDMLPRSCCCPVAEASRARCLADAILEEHGL